MLRHARNYSRRMNWKHALRKRKMCKSLFGIDYFDDLHRYSKSQFPCGSNRLRDLYQGMDMSKIPPKVSDRRRSDSSMDEIKEAHYVDN